MKKTLGFVRAVRRAARPAVGGGYPRLAVRRGRIGEAVAAHAVTNLLIAVYVLAFGQWQLW